jgi:hypothetical protein
MQVATALGILMAEILNTNFVDPNWCTHSPPNRPNCKHRTPYIYLTMMFSLAIVAVIASTVAALKEITPNGDISLNSKLGMRLLSTAEVIIPARFLADNQERDITFVADYSIRYLGCHSLISVAAGNANNNKNNDQGNLLYTTHLARFALCPTSNCNKCEGGGEYAMNMETFVDAYTEALLTEQEYACETVREGCDCENANDDEVCESACYATAGLDYCENDDNNENFEVQRYLECKRKYSTCYCVFSPGSAFLTG